MWQYRYTDELYHYGIKGMKWGVRRFQDKDGSLTSAGKKRYSDDESDSSEETKKKRKLTRKQKAVIIGASIVTAYAAYKFVDSGSASRLIAKGKAALGHTDLDFNKNVKLADKNLNSDEIMHSVVSRINPNYGGLGTKNNCRRCTFAYEMSRRGYDVKATRSVKGTGQTLVGLRNAISPGDAGGKFKFIKESVSNSDSVASKILNEGGTLGVKPITKVGSDYTESIFGALGGYKNGARGELTVEWSCGGRHSMAWEIVKDRPVIFDCQTGKKYENVDAFMELGSVVSKASLTRLDNIDLNNDFLLRWLQNA